MRLLVTGGAGFVGAHLVRRLLDDGHEVVCLDDFSTGRHEAVASFAATERFRLLEQDVRAPVGLEDAAIGAIYHLACPASPLQYQRDPVRTLRVAFEGTLAMLELARRTGARLLLSSTSEIYGEPEVHPQPESYRGAVSTTGPRACYDEGKRAAETLCADYRRQYGVDARIARIFNTYGPGMAFDDGRVVSSFIVQALRREPLKLFGDGAQTRSFCYVDDLVDGLVRLMQHPTESGPINLGNAREVTVRELAEAILALTGSPSRLEHEPLPEDDPTRRCPDIGRATRVLDWQPTVELRTGVAQTIDDFRRRGGAG